MKIAIANDHAGYEMKIVVIKWLEEQGYEIKISEPIHLILLITWTMYIP